MLFFLAVFFFPSPALGGVSLGLEYGSKIEFIKAESSRGKENRNFGKGYSLINNRTVLSSSLLPLSYLFVSVDNPINDTHLILLYFFS